ncbi:MAG: glycosyltransferase involved in cell wall biosynthesis [Psychromonas sp.]|jgi:glycosyltransferase involved in cell wall biosynthesis|uniref:glycosyltransferase family 4 protein n=1 Tax=Psychromonas sp. TaxID=1884585 RepID=UPI0039E21AE5
MNEFLGIKSIIYIVNVDWFFISHRLPIALEAKKRGYKVTIACNFTKHKEELRDMGFNVINIPFTRSGGGFLNELKTIIYIRRVIKEVKPSLVHAVTIKPVLYTGLALKTITKNIPMVAAISGLGYVFTASNLRAKLTRFIASLCYKVALTQKYKIVIFQNSSDDAILTRVANLKCSDKALIKGSGVDLSVYNSLAENNSDGIKVVMACRLLKEKGVYEYIEAAKQVKEHYLDTEFLLVGTPDLENPNTIEQTEIDRWVNGGVINYLGHRNDIPNVFADSNIVCLPSFYGEGVPKVLIEAAACGRAIITTNNPGCKDAIIDGVTGIAVPVRDSAALAMAIIKLIEDSDLRNVMGQKGRLFAEQEFDVNSVVHKHLKIYNNLISTVL